MAACTHAGYVAETARLLGKYYGPGWQHVLKYTELLEKTENATGKCWSVWNEGYMNTYDVDQYDFAVYRERWDEMLAELEAARPYAESRAQESRIERLLVAAIYEGCLSSYYLAYEDYDDEKIAVLDERWAYMIALAKQSGAYGALRDFDVRDTLEDTAWAGAWTKDYSGSDSKLRYKIVVVLEKKDMTRPAPEGYGG